MQTLYLQEPGVELGFGGKCLRVSIRGTLQKRIPIRMVGQVFCFGPAEVTMPAMRALARNNIPLALLSAGGRYQGRITGAAKRYVSLRRIQYRCADDEQLRLQNSSALVGAKLASARALLLRQSRNYPELPLDGPCADLKALLKPASRCETIEELRGIEGRGGAIYFGAFPFLLRDDTMFRKRERRPPRDPVNALLSLGYTMLRLEMESQIESFGLDPYVGVFHVERAGRPALALDLMEEFRVEAIDRLVLRLLNLGILSRDDFQIDAERGCTLRSDGLRLFLVHYHRFMLRGFVGMDKARTNLRRQLHRQVREFVDATREERVYRPHGLRL